MNLHSVLRWNHAFPVVFAGACVFVCASAFAATTMAKPDLSDPNITNEIENEFLIDTVVPFNRIDVKTTDGIVTLDGSVDNLLAKERAANIAETVRGTRSVINEIKVTPPFSSTDAAVAADVENALLADPATDAYEVTPTVTDGVVTLTGNVDSWQEKQLAGTVAKEVEGVTGLKNDIAVNYKATRPDPEIKNDIKEALKWNTLIDDGLIDVTVNNDNVKLSGVVGSASEKGLAEAAAWVAGVKSVNADGLKVERWARDNDLREAKYVPKSDQQIANALKDAYIYDPRVMSFNVAPEVDHGVVTLIGNVDNLKAKRAAAQVARETVGVVSVRNHLKVRPGTAIPDTSIAQGIESALERDPVVDRFDIGVNVVNGKAYLTGTVDDYFEKSEADDAASRVAGVTSVENDLVVDNDHAPLPYDPYVDQWYPYDYTWYNYKPAHPTKSDVAIETSIDSELWWSPFVDADDVKVDVHNGEAHLTGTVNSWSEYEAAQENAYEGGATWVDNDLVVSPS